MYFEYFEKVFCEKYIISQKAFYSGKKSIKSYNVSEKQKMTVIILTAIIILLIGFLTVIRRKNIKMLERLNAMLDMAAENRFYRLPRVSDEQCVGIVNSLRMSE